MKFRHLITGFLYVALRLSCSKTTTLAYLKQMPKSATTLTPFMRLIAEGDNVVKGMSFGWSKPDNLFLESHCLLNYQL